MGYSQSFRQGMRRRTATRAAVFHDHPVAADGLSRLIQTEGLVDVVDVESRLPDFIRAVQRSRPDVVVFGIAEHRRTHAARLVRRFRDAAGDRCPRLVGVMSGRQQAADAWTGDTSAVVTTDVTGAALRDIVLFSTADDDLGVPAELVRPRYREAPPRSAPRAATLTARERQVLAAIAQGLSTGEIAESLGISVNTARTHAQRLMSKLRVHSRLQASALAADQPHLVDPAEVP